MTRTDALITLNFHPGQNPSFRDLQARYRSLAAEKHPDAGGNRKEFEALTEAYNYLKKPPLEPSIKATLNRQLKHHKQCLVNIEATVKLWSPDDDRPERMRQPHLMAIKEIEETLGITSPTAAG